ncbi:MAG TPA: alkyl sulfatase dimerization domain-containing protein [Thermoanaerobaculia bacterium]|nr:alkyl sulfatase dimerization domain-containing protein [Thermoanaerobaculia bacterium]
MPHLLELSERLWTGRDSIHEPAHHPFATLDQIDEIASCDQGSVHFFKFFSNVVAISGGGALVLSDTGSFVPRAHERVHAAVRSVTAKPLHTAIYTHGHADHAYGLPPFLREAAATGAARPQVVAHRCVRERMQRYVLTAGFNALINQRQFGRPTEWPTDPILPTTEYEDRLELTVGERTIELHHGRGETDDHTWVFLPRERVLHTGDFFIWSAPNAGNPQKVQRYAADWVAALRSMATRRPLYLLPGHGLPIAGEERVAQALLETAEYLESLWRQTVEGMNTGASLDDLVHGVRPPAHLADRPFLQPIYDEPEFIVRNVWRCYGGWYDGTPSELKPASRAARAREIAALAGGVERLLERARELVAAGDLRLASHLADWAVEASPDSAEAHAARAATYRARVDEESSTMAKGIFGAAVRESEQRAGGPVS